MWLKYQEIWYWYHCGSIIINYWLLQWYADLQSCQICFLEHLFRRTSQGDCSEFVEISPFPQGLLTRKFEEVFFQMIPLISPCCFYQFWIFLSHCTDTFTNNWTKLCSGTLTELCLYCFGQLGGELVSTKVIRKMPIRKIHSNFNPRKNSKFMNRGNPVTG